MVTIPPTQNKLDDIDFGITDMCNY
jgi:hypothetical protein